MEKSIIEVRNIGKKYNITHQRGGYITMRDVIANIFDNPFAFAVDKTKSAIGLKPREEFWALKNVSFEVKRGEVIGIIGANGAGKSTLLKILSQITPPTTGEIILRGRVGSLLEVGTGFHPELTGRENIFLNGAILGMKKKEIANKFDEIVAFAGIEKFLDTPVKHYSSGMHVRLAFSVAAHMEPEILVVDEVLAVGDAEFQKKCLGKMDEITKKDGRTILFVSHNINAIENLCSNTIILNKGKIIFFGETKHAIQIYNQEIFRNTDTKDFLSIKRKHGALNVKITDIILTDSFGKTITSPKSGEKLIIKISYESKKQENMLDVIFSIAFRNMSGNELFVCANIISNPINDSYPSNGTIKCVIDRLPLSRGSYIMAAMIQVDGIIEDHIEDAVCFKVENGNFYKTNTSIPTKWENKGALIDYKWIS